MSNFFTQVAPFTNPSMRYVVVMVSDASGRLLLVKSEQRRWFRFLTTQAPDDAESERAQLGVAFETVDVRGITARLGRKIGDFALIPSRRLFSVFAAEMTGGELTLDSDMAYLWLSPIEVEQRRWEVSPLHYEWFLAYQEHLARPTRRVIKDLDPD